MATNEPVLGSSATIARSEAEKKAQISGKSEKQLLEELCYSTRTLKMWAMIIAISLMSTFLIDFIFHLINSIQLTHLK